MEAFPGICVLGVPFKSEDFVSSFVAAALIEDLLHIHDLTRIDDPQVAYGILSSFFARRQRYLSRIAWMYSHLSTLYRSFDRKIIHMFGDLLGSGSLECPIGELARRQPSWLIDFGGVGLLSVELLAPLAILGSLALVPPLLCSGFIVRDRLLLLEYISQVEDGLFPLQSSLTTCRDSLLVEAKSVLPIFSALVAFGQYRLQSPSMKAHSEAIFKGIMYDGNIPM